MKVFGLVGWSGSGKTTLMTRLLPELIALGLRVSTMKHSHHGFDVDTPGKDSYRHREAGATEVMVASARRWALMHELRGAPEPGLTEQIERLSPCDLLLVEGFKHERIPKLEVYRAAVGEALIHPHDANIVAVASDAQVQTALPQLDLNDPAAVAAFILSHLGLR